MTKGKKRKGQNLKKKPAKKSKCGEDEDDDDDEGVDPEHDALPGRDGDDDDEMDDFGLEGLDDLLKLDGQEGGGKTSKKPATSNQGTKKKPSTRKRDEAHN